MCFVLLSYFHIFKKFCLEAEFLSSDLIRDLSWPNLTKSMSGPGVAFHQCHCHPRLIMLIKVLFCVGLHHQISPEINLKQHKERTHRMSKSYLNNVCFISSSLSGTFQLPSVRGLRKPYTPDATLTSERLKGNAL